MRPARVRGPASGRRVASAFRAGTEVGFQVRIPSRCSVRGRGNPRTREGCPVRSHRRSPGI